MEFKFYAFDFDDNLLFMSTEIILSDINGEEVGMQTSDFATYRNKVGKEVFMYKGHSIKGFVKNTDGTDNLSSTFRNFRDVNNPDIFLKDTIDAIEKKSFGPSWGDFIECLVTGALFAIITARGHEGSTIREVVEYIIDTQLTTDQQNTMYNNLIKYKYLFNEKVDYTPFPNFDFITSPLVIDYLNLCEFVGVSAPSRLDRGGAVSPEIAKREVLLEFKTRINRYVGNIGGKALIGFSDDDKGTVKVIEELFDRIDYEEFPNITRWVVKNTNEPNNITKSVTVNK